MTGRYFKQHKLRPVLGAVLAVTVLTGCSGLHLQSADEQESTVSINFYLDGFYTGKVGETIAQDSKWVNAMIDGAIDESTETNLKDDFYTAVNKEWILDTELGEEEEVDAFSDNTTIVRDRKISIIQGESAPAVAGTAPTGITQEMNSHNEKLVSDYAALVSDWDTRNEQGVEPARKYVEAIEDIRTMEDLKSYLTDADGLNFTQIEPVSFNVGTPMGEKSINTVIFDGEFSFLLASTDSYSAITPNDLSVNYILRGAVGDLLQELGYTEDEVEYQFMQCYQLEFAAAQILDDIPTDYMTYESEADKEDKTLEEVEALAGNYPIREILSSCGLDEAQKYRVYYPEVVTQMGELFTEDHLPEIRAYYLIHTAVELLPYLDRASFDAYLSAQMYKGIGLMVNSESEEEDILIDYYFDQCFPGAMEEVYVARYCTEEQKEGLLAMTQQYIDSWRQIIEGEDWLSEETREVAVGKLDAITIRCLYPETFVDYTGLDLSTVTSSADAISKVKQYMKKLQYESVDEEIDKSLWNESEIGTTTTVNAMYYAPDNSVNIYAGIIASGEFYDPDASLERNLGGVGAVIGHEISHAFDSTGSQFDKDGNPSSWWGLEDVDAFQVRVDRLANYYNTLTCYRGSLSVVGSQVEGEAMADMGGVKASLIIADGQENFNYDDFFRSYATTWRAKCTIDVMDSILLSDSHPAAFLRVNVTLTEFDEFYETYGITEGDGMYRAPQKRVAVW